MDGIVCMCPWAYERVGVRRKGTDVTYGDDKER